MNKPYLIQMRSASTPHQWVTAWNDEGKARFDAKSNADGVALFVRRTQASRVPMRLVKQTRVAPNNSLQQVVLMEINT